MTCLWDLRQDFESIVPFTIEETYELVKRFRLGIMTKCAMSWATFCFKYFLCANRERETNFQL